MEFFKPNIKETKTLDLTLSSRVKVLMSRFLQHPFVSGFSHAIRSVGHNSADLLNKIKPYRFAGINEVSIHSGKTQSSKLAGQDAFFSVWTGGLVRGSSSIVHTASTHHHKGNISVGLINGQTVVGQQQRDMSHNSKGQQSKEIIYPKDIRTPEARRKQDGITRPRVENQVNLPNGSDAITGLKFSHSRLEGTDITIDVALLASGMGGVLLLEHIADMAIHTRLKKEPTLRGKGLPPNSDRPGNSMERNLESRMLAFADQQKSMQENTSRDPNTSHDSTIKPSVTRIKR